MTSDGDGINTGKEGAQHQEGATDKGGVVIATVDEGERVSSNTNNKCSDGKPKRDTLDILNFLVLCAAFGAALFAGCEARRLADFTDTAIDNASNDAAAQRRIAADTERQQLRAYVFTKPGIVLNAVPNDPKAINVEVIWKNTGITQTRNLSIYTSFGGFTALPNGFRFRAIGPDGKLIPDPRPVHNVLGPADEIPSKDTIIHPKDVDALAAANAHLYIWGWARYGDVFDVKARHLTRFCREVIAVEKNKAGFITHVTSRSCDIGNCAEDECTEQGIP